MKPIQFRLDDETLAQIDAMKKPLKLLSRAAVVREAIRRMARTELPAPKRKGKGC
jgi:Arc/MetJ-type ribon-helix-helix transcriptional regulator